MIYVNNTPFSSQVAPNIENHIKAGTPNAHFPILIDLKFVYATFRIITYFQPCKHAMARMKLVTQFVMKKGFLTSSIYFNQFKPLQ